MKLSSLFMSKIYSLHLLSLSFGLSWRVVTYRFRLGVLVSFVGFILQVFLAYTGAVASTGLRGLSSDRPLGEVLTSSPDVVSDLH